jgi:peptidoglycan/LPS O-acetylase OafA/YrhL
LSTAVAPLTSEPQSAALASAEGRRIPTLDALRGIAILLVLGRHLQYFRLWAKAGWAGVDLFFVLSGFLVSGLIFREWKAKGSTDVVRFYIRRGFKIYPVFYALLLVSVLLPRLPTYAVSHSTILAEAFFVQNYFHGIWEYTWSLAVEEHFYIMLPFLLWLFRKDSRPDDPFAFLPRFFVVIATASLALRIISALVAGHDFAIAWAWLVRTPMRMDGLLFGVLLSYYRHFRPTTLIAIAHNKLTTIGVFGIALPLLFSNENPLMYTAGLTILYLAFGCLLAKVIDISWGRWTAAARPLALIGVYSYSIYLSHGFVWRLLPPRNFPGFCVSLTAALALGVLISKLIEFPMLRLRDRWFA